MQVIENLVTSESLSAKRPRVGGDSDLQNCGRNFQEKEVNGSTTIASVEATAHLKPPESCVAPIMTDEEVAAVSISYEEIENGGLQSLLAKQGVAVVQGVLAADEICELEKSLWQDLEELVDSHALASADLSVQTAWQRVRKDGLHNWPAASLADIGGRGRFQDHGMPHGRFAWNCRTHPRVKHVYEVLHETSNLCASCDNSFVANIHQAEVTKNKSWPHVDQNDHDTRIPCSDWEVYQGNLYIWSSQGSHASTTVVWPGSHKAAYADYMADPGVQKRIAAGRPHFTLIECMVPGPTRDSLIRGWDSGARRVPVPAGALLLWTSRTTHQGWAGGPRLAQPVCWEPRSRQDALMRERKLRLAALGLPSTHWASLALPHELSSLSRPPVVCAVGSNCHDNIHFPLRQEVRSSALTADASVEELWHRLGAADWSSRLPEEDSLFLEASISEEYKAYL
mmetsp:Transcript_130425/g.260216  ORF Transcript_130425/g.260216 Transcript_130425/m.260216 type:complete len:454 (-) Transcript_130425:121-1482(-)